jgi:glyoxylase-like metal-dependent hydrolase (beta-lactamase superfamily II)
MALIGLAGLIVAPDNFTSGLVAATAHQTPAQDSGPIRMRTLRPGDILYVLIGGGGNSLALMRDEGVVLIDTKLRAGGRQILDTIQAVTDKSVTTIINTHAHIDHTGGNSEFTGVTEIVAHAQTKVAMLRLEAFEGSNAKFLPNRIVTDRMTLLDGPDRIELYYFGPGHTNGDLVVVFPEKRIAYFGDLFPSKAAPVIDAENGGSGVAFPETLARAAAEIKGIVQVVTGHEQGLDTERDPRAGSVDTSTGRSAAEAAASLTLADKYKGYDMQHARANVEAIYRELNK